MQSDGISGDVKQLIHGHISSVMQLEVLLFLFTHASASWTIQELVKELRVDAAWLAEEISELCRKGLLVREEPATSGEVSYRYIPKTEELDQAMAGLAAAYADRRVTVTSLIYSKPVDNIRVFADAFRWRKG